MARTAKKLKPTAASRSTPPRKKNPTAKAKAETERKRKNKKKAADDDGASSDDSADEDEDESTKTVLCVNWKKHPELSEKLVAIILEDKLIKQSLFPPCGPNASTTKGGGKPKATAHWELCLLLLGELPRYKESLAAAGNVPADKLAYANKMKNRITAMGKTTRKYNREMGETGAGIDHAADIDMNLQNAFTTKWAAISAECPWYFDMRNLIGQRPNLVPTGLGHSGTAVAPGVIIPTPTVDSAAHTDDRNDDDDASSVLIDDWEPTPPPSPRHHRHKRTFAEIDNDEAPAGSDDVASESAPAAKDEDEDEEDGGGEGEDDDEGEKRVRKKRVKEVKEVKEVKPPRKTPAKPTVSTPAVPTPSVAPKAAKKTRMAEFSEIAKDEERTRRQEIELATLRARLQMKTIEVKGGIVEKREERRRVKEEARREERMMKLEMKKARMQYAHELRMAATGTAMGTGRMSSSASHAGTSFDTYSRAVSDSHCSSSEQPDYPFDGFNGNAVAGSSSSAGDDTMSSFDNFDYSAMDFSNLG
ncbi:hypothetical protein C8R46DRAFT_1220612 [Mycena filopes]|nr:hypothetical protein C8R46DRAFT_1220612 [Mycena filopes]